MRLYDAPGELGLRRGADHQRFFVRQALAAAADHPATTARLIGRKTLLWLSGYEIANNQRFEDATRHSSLLATLLVQGRSVALPFGLLGPLIGAGLVLLGRRRAAEAAPWLVLAAAWAVTPILFFNTARFRLPAVVLLCAPAAAGWARLPAAWREGERRRVALAAALALLLAVVASATIPDHTQLPPSEELNLADSAAEAGRLDEALAWRRRAVERDPDDVMARIRLADTLRVRGACAEALPHYARVSDRIDVAAEWRLAATRSTARCLAALGRYDEATTTYQRVLDADPDQPRTAGRPDFHLRGVPPLAACRIRLERADALRRGGKRAEAAAEFSAVIASCGEADRLAGQAQSGLRVLAQTPEGTPEAGASTQASAEAAATDDARERPR
jgi:tetratricopeptide (TPR) repeat protein